LTFKPLRVIPKVSVHGKDTTNLMTGPLQGDQTDPADRLESALNRIAYALHYQASAPDTSVPAGPAVDLHALAANIDAVTHRIQSLLDDTASGQEG